MHHDSFETGDQGLVMEACKELAEEKQSPVPASLYDGLLQTDQKEAQLSYITRLTLATLSAKTWMSSDHGQVILPSR